MTKQGLTSINIVLDRSGSMKKLAADTIGGFNQFIQDQKKVNGESRGYVGIPTHDIFGTPHNTRKEPEQLSAVLTLATFASDYKLVHDFTPLNDASDLTLETYQPAGYTALLDAIGRTINATGSKLAAMKEEDRPSQVLFVIMTDGEENASHEFTKQQVFSMIEHQKTKYNWLFTFIGASQSAITDAKSFGISAANAVCYDSKSAAGSLRAFSSISQNTASYRRTKIADGGLNFFDQGNISVKADDGITITAPNITTKK